MAWPRARGQATAVPGSTRRCGARGGRGACRLRSGHGGPLRAGRPRRQAQHLGQRIGGELAPQRPRAAAPPAARPPAAPASRDRRAAPATGRPTAPGTLSAAPARAECRAAGALVSGGRLPRARRPDAARAARRASLPAAKRAWSAASRRSVRREIIPQQDGERPQRVVPPPDALAHRPPHHPDEEGEAGDEAGRGRGVTRHGQSVELVRRIVNETIQRKAITLLVGRLRQHTLRRHRLHPHRRIVEHSTPTTIQCPCRIRPAFRKRRHGMRRLSRPCGRS